MGAAGRVVADRQEGRPDAGCCRVEGDADRAGPTLENGAATSGNDPEFDRVADAADVETDPRKRLELCRKGEQIILDDAVNVPLYRMISQTLVKPYVRDYQINGMGFMPHYKTRIVK